MRSTTLEDYKVTVRVHLLPTLGGIEARTLTTAYLQGFYADKLAAGTSARVIDQCHQRLAQALRYGVARGLLTRNVAQAALRPRVERREMRTWTAEEARQFLAVADRSAYGPIWQVLLGTGMRRRETLGLRWRDVDWQHDTLTVAQNVVPFKGRGHIQAPKTPTSRRTVSVPPAVMNALRAHRLRQDDRRCAAGGTWQEHDLVFAAANWNPIHPDNLARDYKRVLTAAGVPRIRIHDQRHTHITLALQAGTPLHAVSRRVGHARPSTTLDIYAHVTDDMQDQVATVINAVLFDAPAHHRESNV